MGTQSTIHEPKKQILVIVDIESISQSYTTNTKYGTIKNLHSFSITELTRCKSIESIIFRQALVNSLAASCEIQ